MILAHKEKYIVRVDYGEGNVSTNNIRGSIKKIIIDPLIDNVVYDFYILDNDGDHIFLRKNLIGRNEFAEDLIICGESFFNVVIGINNSTENVDFKIILIVKEK